MAVLILNNFVGASNISLNLGQTTEFGQGLVLTTTCDTHITAKISREFDATDNTFYVKDLTIGDISTKLHSKRVTLVLRNDSTNSNLTSGNLYFDLDENGIVFTSPLAHTDVINYSTSSNFGQNEIGISSITFTNIRNANGSKIPTDDVNRVLLETSKGGGCTAPEITCATVASACQVGSTGPGGGTVFYKFSTPILLQGSGIYINYLEVATGAAISSNPNSPTPNQDPKYPFCSASNNQNPLGWQYRKFSDEVGYGKSNSDYIYANYPQCASSGTALALIKAYRGGGKTDWFLPTIKEWELLMDYRTATGSALTLGWPTSNANSEYYWVSSNYDSTNTGYAQFWSGTSWYSETILKARTASTPTNLYRIRPVRAF